MADGSEQVAGESVWMGAAALASTGDDAGASIVVSAAPDPSGEELAAFLWQAIWGAAEKSFAMAVERHGGGVCVSDATRLLSFAARRGARFAFAPLVPLAGAGGSARAAMAATMDGRSDEGLALADIAGLDISPHLYAVLAASDGSDIDELAGRFGRARVNGALVSGAKVLRTPLPSEREEGIPYAIRLKSRLGEEELAAQFAAANGARADFMEMLARVSASSPEGGADADKPPVARRTGRSV